MSTCKICAANGKPGIEITWSEKIKSAHTGKLIPLETDGSTFHKHYEPTNGNGSSAPTPAFKTISSTQIQRIDPKVDLNIIKVIAAALQEYITIKEAGK
jgi:hypothetical protein